MALKTHIKTKPNHMGVIAFVILLFTLVNSCRLFPFQDTLWESQVKVQEQVFVDWDWYAQYALNVKKDGIFNQNPMSTPTSFLYTYFLAICFFLFGENTIPVYVIQSMLLSISIILIYFAFYNKLKSKRILLLGTLIIFGLFDINKYYTFRCLSENLTIFLLAVFLFSFIKGIEKNQSHFQLLSSLSLALACLTRPNIWIFAFIAILIYANYIKNFRKILVFISIFILISSIQPLTNYLINGNFMFFPSDRISFENNGYFSAALSIRNSFRNLLSCFGFMSFTNPEFLWRPHWTIMWLAYFIGIIFKIKEKQKFEFWEIISHLLIASYYLVIVLVVNPDNGSYGTRFFLPAILVVLAISFVTNTNQIIEKIQKHTQ